MEKLKEQRWLSTTLKVLLFAKFCEFREFEVDREIKYLRNRIFLAFAKFDTLET